MRPFLSINVAISLDGKISDANGRPSGWTSREDFARLIELRRNADALLVGRRTLMADSMTLMVPGRDRQPLRCIVSRSGDIPHDHPVLHSDGGTIHLLGTEKPGGQAPGVIGHHGTTDRFLRVLREEHGVETIHCEGGGWLLGELARLDVIDRIHLTIAGHSLFGGRDAPTMTGIPGLFDPPNAARYQLDEWLPHPAGNECFLTYTRDQGSQ